MRRYRNPWIDHTGLTKTQSLNPFHQNKMVKYLTRACAACWASFQRADITHWTPNMGGFVPPPPLWGLATTNPSKKTATVDIYIRRRLCGSQVVTCSGNWSRDAAAATLTLQVSRQALLSGACLSAPRDCNFICRVILHRSDPQFYGKRCPQ